ncbi:MAG: 3'-5' exonuclease, partial [Thermomicrobiales bacterium]
MTDPAEEPEVDDRYLHLERRAEEFLRARGGSVHEDQVIAHVFGSAGSPDLWRPLIRRFLSKSESLVLRADGCWAVSGLVSDDPSDLLGDFVALDVETTGLKPTQQRIIEVAAIRFSGGVVTERFESLVNPGRTLPKYIVQLTRIDDLMVSEAPLFGDVAPRLLEMLEGALIVGHNVAFDISFVNAELERLTLPGLVNDRIDTMGLT